MNVTEAVNGNGLYASNGWVKATPEEQGINSGKLTEMMDYLKINFPCCRTVSIYRKDRLIFDYSNDKPYESAVSKTVRNIMRGVGPLLRLKTDVFLESYSKMYNLRSVTKSVVALLIGIAIQEGYINGVEDTLEMYFNGNPGMKVDEKKKITLQQLLTMKSGLNTIDRGTAAIKLLKSKDWVDFILKNPLQSKPGTVFDYNSANPHLLSAVITKATGMSAADFAKKYLFGPLGITEYAWEADPKGNNFGGGNLYLSQYDLAKIGMLILHQGKWKSDQIVSQHWLEEAFTRYHYWDYGFHYGYLLYIKDEINEENGKSYVSYSAAGVGGQKLLILPEADIILTVTSQVDFTMDKSYFLNIMIGKYLLPSIID